MVINHMKRCSTLLSTKEMHIKAIMKYHYTSIRKAKTKTNKKNLTVPSTGEYVDQLELLPIADDNAKWYKHHSGKQCGSFL